MISVRVNYGVPELILYQARLAFMFFCYENSQRSFVVRDYLPPDM